MANIPTLESMLEDGFTERMAKEYLGILETERNSGMFDPAYLEWSHSHGFCAESACAYGLTEDNLSNYFSDYDYWKLWPLNSWQRIWINDKLTLNALVQDSELEKYVPAYYFYSTPEGLLPLKGGNYRSGAEGFIEVLKEQGTFACKPCNGTEAAGFHKLQWDGNGFLIDSVPCPEDDVHAFVAEHPNYVFTEFIRPSEQMRAINPLIHTIRILVINPTGADPKLAAGYLRFALEGDDEGTGANYVTPTNAGIGAFNVDIDLATGAFGDGKLVYANRIEDAPCHPISGTRAEGVIPEWDELLKMVKGLSLKVGACEYLGFDACITDKGPMIMEINSHSGIKYLQIAHPIMQNEELAAYYAAKLQAIDSLDEAGKRRRNAVVR